MQKREAVISTCYARKDIDGTVLWFTVWVKEANSNSDYVYRYDFGPANMEKTFWFKDESRCNSLVWQHCYINITLSLK